MIRLFYNILIRQLYQKASRVLLENQMKALSRIIATVLIIIALVSVFVGCNRNELRFNTDYIEYYFDSADNRYIETGRKLRLADNKLSFTMTFSNLSSIIGALVVEDDINGLVLSVANEAFEPFMDNYSQYLSEAYADTYSAETIEELLKQIHIKEQMYYDNKHIFSSRSLQLVKSISEENSDYSVFEGTYDSVKDEAQYLFKNGRLYLVEEGKPSETAYGTYTVNESYVTVTRVDESGEPLYKEGSLIQLSYLYTTISFPDNFSIVTDVDDDEYSEFVDDTASLLAGKKVAVLVSTFYLAE